MLDPTNGRALRVDMFGGGGMLYKRKCQILCHAVWRGETSCRRNYSVAEQLLWRWVRLTFFLNVDMENGVFHDL